ncbi:MAG: isochorismatase family protein [Pyrinomonadaceae bacterium]
MATVREGDKTALLVVDVQRGVVENCYDRDRIVSNIAAEVEKARSKEMPVVWIQHSDDELIKGSENWEIVSELSPAADEARIDKHFESSFEGTELETTLAAANVSHIMLAGAATNWCIRATAYGALDRGYDLTLLKDCHTTSDLDFGEGVRVEAKSMILDLNTVMTWIQYPGRKAGVA